MVLDMLTAVSLVAMVASVTVAVVEAYKSRARTPLWTHDEVMSIIRMMQTCQEPIGGWRY